MLAIVGGKGGCGKTTTALGLARAFVREGETPLVVDADCDMPDVHHVADLRRSSDADQFDATTQLQDVVRSGDRFPGVRILTVGRRDAVHDILERAVDWSGPVLVDCPPGTSPDTARPLRHADSALVVTTDQPACLEDTTRTVRTLRQLKVPLAGAILVSHSGGSGPRAVTGCRVLGTSPYVANPFGNSRVRRVWQMITHRLISGDTIIAGNGTYKPTP